MIELRNHTPHVVVLEFPDGRRVELARHAPVPYRPVRRTVEGSVPLAAGPFPATRTTLAADVVDLPEPAAGVLLVVGRMVAESRPDRADLLFPDDLVRDAAGQVVACRALGRVVEQ